MQAIPEVRSNYLIDDSFQNQSCKLLRVVGRCLYSLISSLFYAVIGTACWLVQKSAYSEEFFSRSGYHFERLISTAYGYCAYGDLLINFSVNRIGALKVSDLDTQERLTNLYGNQFTEWLEAASSEILPIDPNKLQLVRGGICMGMSLDFIARYRKELEKSHDAPQAIECVSKSFEEYATKEAHITQILYEAQDVETLRKSLQSASKQNNSILENMNQAIDLITVDDSPDEIERKLNLCVVPELKEEKEPEPLDEQNIRTIRFAHLAKNFEMNVTHTNSLEANGSLSVFEEHLQALNPGTYLFCNKLASLKNGHATAYIKVSEDLSYYFNPSCGTIELTQDPAKCLYEPNSNFYFFECH